MPSPRQQSLFDSDAYRAAPAPSRSLDPAGKLFDTTPYQKPAAATRPSQAEHVSSVHGGEQLKMFMTPKEIHAGWQPLDADRHESDEGGTWEGTYSPKSWDTGNTQPTDINEAGTSTYNRVQRRARGLHTGPGGDDTGTIRRTWGGGKVRVHDRDQGGGMESDDELWDRKLDEAQQYPVGGQHEEYGGAESDPLAAMHRGSTMGSYQGAATVRPGERMPRSSAWDRHYAREQSHEDRRMEQDDARQSSRGSDSLYDSIAEQGVMGPIRLGREIGSMGKPQIVGGHHRMAAATAADPNRLVPVLHDENIREAQRKGGSYPYA